MKKIVDPFNFNLPTLDLHGETSFSTPFLVNTFISDNKKMGNKKILIIHGKGSGIVRKVTHSTLKKNKFVSKYYIDGGNDGQTIVQIIWQNRLFLILCNPNGK